MRLDVRDLVAGRGRNRLQCADLVGHQVFNLPRRQSWNRAAAESVQIAITGVSADTDAARLRKLHRAPHDVGVTGMEAAGDIDRCRNLDHGGIISHLPGAKAFAEIAVEIDCLHGDCSLLGNTDAVCQVSASTALTALPATLALCRASRLNSTWSGARKRSGRERNSAANFLVSACASAMVTALKRKARPADICAKRPKSAEITVAILG